MSEAVEYRLYFRWIYLTLDAQINCQSYYDEPACINTYGRRCSYSYKEKEFFHRNDAPAIIYYDDTMEWYSNGVSYNPECKKL